MKTGGYIEDLESTRQQVNKIKRQRGIGVTNSSLLSSSTCASGKKQKRLPSSLSVSAVG